MKKRILFVIPNLVAGGAEKSLVNLLNSLDSNKYEVDLFLFHQEGLFLKQVPKFVKILPLSGNLEIFQKPLFRSLFNYFMKGQFVLAFNRLRYAVVQQTNSNHSLAEQYSWKFKRKAMGRSGKEYDAAIGFLEKSCIYFVVDQVKAFKKIGFIHTYYSKLNADLSFDEHYFSVLNNIITVSEECKEDLRHNFTNLKDRITMIQNIISSKLIKKLAKEKIEDFPKNSIISVGRLVDVKGFDLAVEAAKILKDKKIDFHWFIIGEGEERKNLEKLIEKYDLQDHFQLLGLKENPYPFIEKADVFVQPSRYEGKSISVDEAKILAKPIVLTNFTTAKDQIENGFNGLICEMSAVALAESILKYLEDPEFTAKVIANLEAEEFGTEDEIEKLYELIDA